MANHLAPDFIYDLPRLLHLYRLERELAGQSSAGLHTLAPVSSTWEPRAVAILAGSFNPLTRGHEALIRAARREGFDAALLLLPLRAVDKEGVTRASAVDRALVLQQWAARHDGVGVALANRGLYVEQAGLLAARYRSSRIVFVVGHDKIVQIFDPRYYSAREAALRALFARATFRVAPRLGQGEAALQDLLARAENQPFASYVAPLALEEDVDALSSTAVRERAGAGEPWEELVPEETAVFVREARPYASAVRLWDGEEIDPYGLRQALIAALATHRLSPDGDDFAALYHIACSATPAGKRLRAQLAISD